MMTEEILFWFVAGACVLFVASEKSGFGSGLGAVTTPMLTLVTGHAAQAAGILLPVLIVTDWIALYFWWGKGSWRNYWLIIPGAVVGITAGSLFLLYVLTQDIHPDTQKRLLKQVIGVIALGFVVYRMARPWLERSVRAYTPQAWQGWLAGGVAGVASTFAHAGGPPVVLFLLPQQLGRQVFVGTTVALFTTINLLKLGPYYYLGLIGDGNWKISLYLLPLVPVGVLCGVWANGRVKEEWFVRVVYVGLFVVGLGYVTGWL